MIKEPELDIKEYGNIFDYFVLVSVNYRLHLTFC